jgi:23S rRNA A1618 N6-methylase RlmF
MREGQELKLDPAHAVRDLTIPGTAFDRRPVQVATAADNELITPGGEIAFVGRMIEESLQTRQRCSHVDHLTVWQNTDDHGIRWYTSLIGKYSSLQSLVDRLRTHQVSRTDRIDLD